jgi:nickel-dependent lactate racemase
MKALTPEGAIRRAELSTFLSEVFYDAGRSGEHVLVVVPDDTRSIPMAVVFDALRASLAPRVRKLTFLIALGTHPPMTARRLDDHLGVGWRTGTGSGVTVEQHDWRGSDALRTVGTVNASELAELSGGLMEEDVPIRIHRLALEADRIVIVNPVFPHEVVGFSGGHKYFFPGIAGPEILDASHWLGALITNPKVNGHKETPVRALIERAAQMIPTERVGVSVVMNGRDPVGVFVDDVYTAWSAAADLSAETNIVWVDRAYHTVVSVAPSMYRELWTAGKCMYKLEPVVTDGGRLVIYAPHIEEISPTHGDSIRRVGYHTRDYFLAQLERFRDVPRAVLAHSTHVKGIGTFVAGVERPRIEVVLATGIPEAVCREINLAYSDPDSFDVAAYEGRKGEGILVVPNAGETLYRLADGSVPDVDAL